MPGYLSNFFWRKRINLPTIHGKPLYAAKVINLRYTHFSICYSVTRKQPIFTAVNIDGKSYKPSSRRLTAERWYRDTKVAKEDQLDNSFYSLSQGHFHRGHLVRRLDPGWGTPKASTAGRLATFHFTNASPQHAKFNPAIWLELERNVLEYGAVKFGTKLSVFSGPVLAPDDEPFFKLWKGLKVLIPARFWKIIVWQREDGKVAAVGFIQSQKALISDLLERKVSMRAPVDDHFQNLKFKGDAVYQIDIKLISKITNLNFNWKKVVYPLGNSRKVRLDIPPTQRGLSGPRRISGLVLQGR
jgi:endonuclease G, mitochondrial